MKNKKYPSVKSRNRKFPLLPALALIVIAAVVLFYILANDDSKANNQDEAAKQAQQEAMVNSDAKKEFVEQETSPPNQSDNPKAQPAPAPSAPASKNIELTARQEANSTVTVFTKLLNYSEGSCQLQVVNGTKTATQNAAIVYQREFSSCAGFSVPIDPLGKGTWTIRLTTNSAGTSDTKIIALEIK